MAFILTCSFDSQSTLIPLKLRRPLSPVLRDHHGEVKAGTSEQDLSATRLPPIQRQLLPITTTLPSTGIYTTATMSFGALPTDLDQRILNLLDEAGLHNISKVLKYL